MVSATRLIQRAGTTKRVTESLGVFFLRNHSQQIGDFDKVGLIDRQLLGPVPYFSTNTCRPLWNYSLWHVAPPFMPANHFKSRSFRKKYNIVHWLVAAIWSFRPHMIMPVAEGLQRSIGAV